MTPRQMHACRFAFLFDQRPAGKKCASALRVQLEIFETVFSFKICTVWIEKELYLLDFR